MRARIVKTIQKTSLKSSQKTTGKSARRGFDTQIRDFRISAESALTINQSSNPSIHQSSIPLRPAWPFFESAAQRNAFLVYYNYYHLAQKSSIFTIIFKIYLHICKKNTTFADKLKEDGR